MFEYLLRVARYIVATKHLCLTLTAPAVTPEGLDLFQIHANSLHGNADAGMSHEGLVLLSNGCGPGGAGGGAFAWKCESPPEGDDSSGAAELRMVVRSIKYTTGIRTIQRDLDVGNRYIRANDGAHRRSGGSEWAGR